MSAPQLITQEIFVEALATGIAIPAETSVDMFNFGERLIRWINSTDNVYWAAWCPENPNRVLMDLRNCELMQLWIEPGRLQFRRTEPDVEHTMAKEFGNGAIGVMLFCMLENKEIEELDLDKIAGIEPKPEPKPEPNLVVYPDDDSDDFDWI